MEFEIEEDYRGAHAARVKVIEPAPSRGPPGRTHDKLCEGGGPMGAMLNEESITGFLLGVVNHLETGNLEQAEVALDILDFERLMVPIRSNTKPPQIIDPAEEFSRGRVHETGNHIRACRSALKAGNRERALGAAKAAAARWAKRA